MEGKCSECYLNCKSCNGLGSFNCFNCFDGKVFYNFICVNVCLDWMYVVDKDDIYQCLLCYLVCYLCYGLFMDSCFICKSLFYFEGRMCVVQCLFNYYIDEYIRICYLCGSECKLFVWDKNCFIQYIDNKVL